MLIVWVPRGGGFWLLVRVILSPQRWWSPCRHHPVSHHRVATHLSQYKKLLTVVNLKNVIEKMEAKVTKCLSIGWGAYRKPVWWICKISGWSKAGYQTVSYFLLTTLLQYIQQQNILSTKYCTFSFLPDIRYHCMGPQFQYTASGCRKKPIWLAG